MHFALKEICLHPSIPISLTGMNHRKMLLNQAVTYRLNVGGFPMNGTDLVALHLVIHFLIFFGNLSYMWNLFI